MAPAHETVIRAVGMALASLSAAFAMYMLAYGAGKTRINGMEHLAIFAQPRGPGGVVRGPTPPSADVSTPVDMAATGSLAASAGQAGGKRAAGRDRRRASRPRLAEDRWRNPHGDAGRRPWRAWAESGRSLRATAAGSCSTTRARSFSGWRKAPTAPRSSPAGESSNNSAGVTTPAAGSAVRFAQKAVPFARRSQG